MTEKRKRDDDGDALAAHKVALHYSGRDNQTTAQRQQSPIYHLRCLNNWVRAFTFNVHHITPFRRPSRRPRPSRLRLILAAFPPRSIRLASQVKSTVINSYVREKDRVLDFACGKGGDLTKYKKAGVGTYAGVDIALESVRRDAVERYNAGDYPFPARFIAGDCFTADLTRVLPERAHDVISCQFAVHYR